MFSKAFSLSVVSFKLFRRNLKNGLIKIVIEKTNYLFISKRRNIFIILRLFFFRVYELVTFFADQSVQNMKRS